MERGRIVWGIILLLGGGYLLALNLDLVPQLATNVWAIILGAVSVLFFGTYLTSGVHNWGWLFPAMGFGSVALIVALNEAGVDGEWLGSIVLLSMAVPFWVAYALVRGREWWPLIPGGILTVVGALPALSTLVEGEVVGSIFLYAIALPFLIVFLRNRAHWWALIPAGSLLVIGTLPLLAAGESAEELVGAFFLLGLGTVFLLVYLFRRDNWWALIPAGSLATVGLVAGLSPVPTIERFLPATFFAGLTATFLVLWLLRDAHATGWAVYPVAGLAAATALAVILGSRFELIWPILLLAGGAWLVYRALRAQAT